MQQTPRPAFFARKFEAIINQRIINDVDTWLYGDYKPDDITSMNSYWQNAYHREDTVTITTDTVMTIYQSFIRLIAAHINWRAQVNIVDISKFSVKHSRHIQGDMFQLKGIGKWVGIY